MRARELMSAIMKPHSLNSHLVFAGGTKQNESEIKEIHFHSLSNDMTTSVLQLD